MAYDPFMRGQFPVGVLSGELVDQTREQRQLPYGVWYPADGRVFGLDMQPPTQDRFTVVPNTPPLRQAAVRGVPPAEGNVPLVLFSHTSLGHRRQSSFLCTHLASHGYIVAAVDHTGNTFGDWAAGALTGEPFTTEDRDVYIQRMIAARVPDVRLLLDHLLDGGVADLAGHPDAGRVGLVGWSFGGWTVLATPEVDTRVGAVVALAPAGNSKPLPGVIPVTLTFAWQRAAPTLYLAAECDRYTPPGGIQELLERTPADKAMFILRHADHDHFGDHIEGPHCPVEHAHLFTRGLTLAHLDAALKGDEAARAFMEHGALEALRDRDIGSLAVTGDGPE